MSNTDPKYPLITWQYPFDASGGAYTFDLVYNLGLGSEEVASISMAASTLYGWVGNASDVPQSGSIGAAIASELVADGTTASFAVASVTAAYVTGTANPHPVTTWTLTTTGSPTTVHVRTATDDLRQIGCRVVSATSVLALSGATNTWVLTTNAPWSGIWSPNQLGYVDDDDFEWVGGRTFSDFAPTNYATVRLGERTRRRVTWRNVSGFYVSPDKMAMAAFQTQAAIDPSSVVYQAPNYGHLADLLDAVARGRLMRMYTAAGAYTQVQATAEMAHNVMGLAESTGLGASRYTVRLDFWEV